MKIEGILVMIELANSLGYALAVIIIAFVILLL